VIEITSTGITPHGRPRIFAAAFYFTPSPLGLTEQLGPRYNDHVMSQTGPPGR